MTVFSISSPNVTVKEEAGCIPSSGNLFFSPKHGKVERIRVWKKITGKKANVQRPEIHFILNNESTRSCGANQQLVSRCSCSLSWGFQVEKWALWPFFFLLPFFSLVWKSTQQGSFLLKKKRQQLPFEKTHLAGYIYSIQSFFIVVFLWVKLWFFIDWLPFAHWASKSCDSSFLLYPIVLVIQQILMTCIWHLVFFRGFSFPHHLLSVCCLPLRVSIEQNPYESIVFIFLKKKGKKNDRLNAQLFTAAFFIRSCGFAVPDRWLWTEGFWKNIPYTHTQKGQLKKSLKKHAD